MPVLASLAAFMTASEAISTLSALDAALAAVGELVDCPLYLLLVPDMTGCVHALASPDEPWLGMHAALIGRIVQRAGVAAPRGFVWRDVQRLTALARPELAMLRHAHRVGIRSGITVPLSGPGAVRGSCTLCTPSKRSFGPSERAALHVLLAPIWSAARRLVDRAATPPPTLTARQRECLVWAARGKTDWEIAVILGVREDTIDHHLRGARERYGVDKRSTLIVRALFDGTISFEEALGGG